MQAPTPIRRQTRTTAEHKPVSPMIQERHLCLLTQRRIVANLALALYRAQTYEELNLFQPTRSATWIWRR
jgi:hypothetical protein